MAEGDCECPFYIVGLKPWVYFRFRTKFQDSSRTSLEYRQEKFICPLSADVAFITPSDHRARGTTVGLPGTGLSYTSVNRRKRVDRLSDNEIAKAVEWSKTQDETFHLNLPDRTPGEPPALPEQIANHPRPGPLHLRF